MCVDKNIKTLGWLKSPASVHLKLWEWGSGSKSKQESYWGGWETGLLFHFVSKEGRSICDKVIQFFPTNEHEHKEMKHTPPPDLNISIQSLWSD